MPISHRESTVHGNAEPKAKRGIEEIDFFHVEISYGLTELEDQHIRDASPLKEDGTRPVYGYIRTVYFMGDERIRVELSPFDPVINPAFIELLEAIGNAVTDRAKLLAKRNRIRVPTPSAK